MKGYTLGRKGRQGTTWKKKKQGREKQMKQRNRAWKNTPNESTKGGKKMPPKKEESETEVKEMVRWIPVFFYSIFFSSFPIFPFSSSALISNFHIRSLFHLLFQLIYCFQPFFSFLIHVIPFASYVEFNRLCNRFSMPLISFVFYSFTLMYMPVCVILLFPLYSFLCYPLSFKPSFQ